VREVERSAPSVEEAVEAALEELGVSEQEADVQIVEEGRSGLLGFGAQDAVVRVRVRTEPVDEEELEEQAEAAEEFLDGLFDVLDLSVDLDHAEADGVMYVDVLAGEESEEDVGLLIGRHGQTLDALQEITRSAVQRQFQSRSRIVVDVEDYRKRRRSQLSRKAKDLARRVRQTGRPERLDPMNPFERKIVHDAAAEIGGVETISEGEDPERRVVIKKRS
jgi:spoIIIJ-associated protein